MAFPTLAIGRHEAEHAIIQGGMAVKISRAKLAAAVADSGGIGVIGASGMTPDELRAEIRLTKHYISPDATGTFGVNIMWAVREFKSLLVVCIEEDVPLVFVGAGIVQRWAYEMAEGSITEIVPIISSGRVLKIMFRRYGIEPPAFVAESGKAGGHLGTDASTEEVVADVVGTAKELGLDIPIIPAGGIRTGRNIYELQQLGATGAQLGIPFACTDEVRDHAPGWVDVLIKANKSVVVGSKKFPVSPTTYPGRYVVTPAIEKILAEGVIHLDEERPSCGRVCLEHCVYRDSKFCRSMCIFRRLVLAVEGDVEEGIFFTGSGVADLNKVVPAREVMDRLVKEYFLATNGSF